MKFRLQLVAEDEQESDEEVVELAVLERDCKRLDHLGLTLAESKEILGTLQQHVLERQAATFVENRRSCPGRGRRLGLKGHHTITFRTLFGNFALDSPRLRRCRCGGGSEPVTFSPLTERLPEYGSGSPTQTFYALREPPVFNALVSIRSSIQRKPRSRLTSAGKPALPEGTPAGGG